MRRADLEITNLTLEPIAAINAIIPQDIRKLNLVLLDIGAGTSDIALTRDGAVVAYGMVPEAGDEITEIICEKFILDFSTGEKIKRVLTKQQKVRFRDILGKEYELDSRVIIDAIYPRVKELAKSVAEAVCSLNQKAPHAIILVGGGSLTPFFDKELACALLMPESNIGIRSPEMVDGVKDNCGKLKGPDMVTPLGICIMTAQSSGLKFVELYINERRVYVLDMQQNLDVLSGLVSAGIDKMKLYGKIGQAICVEVNGKLKVIKGKMGRPAQIKLNGEIAALTAKIKHKDKISFEQAEDGENAFGKVGDVIEEVTLHVNVNGENVEIKPRVIMNGMPVGFDTELPDRANIEYNNTVQARDVLEKIGVDPRSLQEREIVIRVNKEPRVLSQGNYFMLVDSRRGTLDCRAYDGSLIEFKADQTAFYKIKDVVDAPLPGRGITVMLNGQKHLIPGSPGKIFMNGQLVSPDEFLIDRAEIITRLGDNMPPTVSQVLEYLPIKIEEQKGKLIRITVNGKPGGFTTPLSEGTDINIGFVERSGCL